MGYCYRYRCCYESIVFPWYFYFVVQIMAIPDIIKAKIIAKIVRLSKLHTALYTFIMCMVWHAHRPVPICC